MTQEEFVLRLSEDCAVAPGSCVLAAVSGGADSVALLCFFAQIRRSYPLRLVCAHVEHGIRGEQSRADMAFVQALCKRMDIPCFCTGVDALSYAAQHGCGVEAAARELRYAFLHRTADEVGAQAIALAHHAGDQAETVLLHLARGSDIQGLCAMRMRSGRLIRPLLTCSPDELRAYLSGIGQDWREDESNSDFRYARNRVRAEVIPLLERVSAGAGEALCRLSRAAQRDEDYFAQLIDGLNLQIIDLIDGTAVRKAALLPLHPALLSRVMTRLMDRAGIDRQNAQTIGAVMDALRREKAVVNLTGGAHASVGRRYLCLTRPGVQAEETALDVPGQTDTPFGRFEVRPALPGETGDGRTEQVFPLRMLCGVTASGRRSGDVIIPFGKHSPVRLKKLMIDAGIERAMRKSVPVLRREDTVLFAVGLRPAECLRAAQEEEKMLVRFLGPRLRSEDEQENQEDQDHD